MADQPTTPSGSRWEPDPDETPTDQTPIAGEEAPSADPLAAYAPIPGPGSEPSDGPDRAAADRRAQLRGRAILAGAATALTLGGGLTGFVIGHSTAGNDAGFRPAGTFQRDGSGQLGEGRQGPPSFGDRDGDGDHGFGQAPQDFGDGGSGSSSNSSSGT